MPDLHKREKLLEIILAQPEHDQGRALVTAGEYFDGNDDLGSIGCNLCDHPGLGAFRSFIDDIAALPSVDQVWLQIYDFDEGDWPFSENILVFGGISTDEVAAHSSAIQPSEICELNLDWNPSRQPALAGRRYVNLWWD
jgi:hypothetical protein